MASVSPAQDSLDRVPGKIRSELGAVETINRARLDYRRRRSRARDDRLARVGQLSTQGILQQHADH